jgi:transposase
MNLKIGKSNGRTYLSIVHGFRDSVSRKVRSKTIKSLGYLDELEKQYGDPVAHFKKVVEEMNKQEAELNPPAFIRIDKNAGLKNSPNSRKNLGYAPLSQIYHELDLNIFFNNHSRKLKADFNINNIMKLLVFSRIISPSSKMAAFENKDLFFENTDFTLVDIYRCLSFVNTLRHGLQLYLHQKIKERYGRTTELVYYDVTNYYFEIDRPDSMRKKGVSKEHRPDPIVQMGLFMDTNGIPISYSLYPGNTHDSETLIPLLGRMKREYNLGRVIVVADKGINTARNIVFSLIRGDGYIYSQRVRGGHKELKDYVLDSGGYRQLGSGFKIKSRLYPREIEVNGIDGKKRKERIPEKQVVFYSEDYDRKAKAEREGALLKARDLVGNPAKYNKATSYGAAKYVKNLVFDEKTGEILTAKQVPVFDYEKLREEEKFDGYYAIVTSESEKTDEEIIGIYRGLWKIEESFKVTKSDLETRPVYLSREDRIQAHFLICFIALTLVRILERKLGNKFAATRIIDSLKRVSCSYLEENWYLFDYADEVTAEISEAMGIPLDKKYLRLGEIKKILGDTKKA